MKHYSCRTGFKSPQQVCCDVYRAGYAFPIAKCDSAKDAKKICEALNYYQQNGEGNHGSKTPKR